MATQKKDAAALRKQFNADVQKVFDEFRERATKASSEEVFDKAYAICKIASLKDYLTQRDDSFVEGLYPFGGSVLIELNEFECAYDVPMFLNWDDVDIMVKDFLRF